MMDAATLTAPTCTTTRKRYQQATTRLASQVNNKDEMSLVSQRGGGRSSSSSSAWMVGLKDSLASALAAACSKTILAPFDTIKTIQQQYTSPNGGGSDSLGFLPACRLICSRPQGFWSLYVRADACTVVNL